MTRGGRGFGVPQPRPTCRGAGEKGRRPHSRREAVQTCSACSKELEDNARFCPECGKPLTETSSGTPTRTPADATKKKSDLQLPLVVGTRYRIEELRGGGGMAKVYRGTDLTLQREVAV